MQSDTAPPPLDAGADLKRRIALDGRTRVDRAACLRAMREGAHGAWVGSLLGTMRGAGRLTVDEFLYYRLYRDTLSDEHRARYVGKRRQSYLHFRCNDRGWLACANDKLLYQTILHAHDLPRPTLRAVFARGGGSGGEPWRRLTDETALEGYLRAADSYPVFAKPIEGIYSIGAMRLHGLEGEDVLLGRDRRIGIASLAAYIREIDARGYLFQAPLATHPRLEPLLGAGLPAARMMVLLGEDGPRVHIATLKLPLAGHDADNFWRSGNLLAPIALEDGRLGEAVTGVAHDTRRLARHPQTDAPIGEIVLPDWEAAKRLVLRAAPCFAGIRTQGWDVAFSSDGPVLLELNFGGDLNLHQLAHDRGVLDAGFCAHLRRCGVRIRLPS